MGLFDGLFGGSGGTHTTTTQQQLPPWANSGLARGAEIARWQQREGTGVPAYPDFNTFPWISPRMQQGMNMIQGPAWDQLTSTLQGDYLHGGPGFNAAVDAAANKIIPQVQSQFGRAGQYGSGLEKQAMTSAIADAFASQYGQERGRQMQGLALAPSLYMAPGVRADQYRAAEKADEVNRYWHNAGLPSQRADQYIDRISQLSGMAPRSQSSSQPIYSSPIGSALGGAMMGSQIGPMLGLGGPWGAIGGGILGLLA